MTDDFLAAFEAKRAARMAADRSFQLGGETLTFRPSVAPEIGMHLEEMRQRVRSQIENLQAALAKAEKPEGNGADPDLSPITAALESMDISESDMLQIGDETILACLEPASHEAWARLRSNDAAQPLIFDEVFEIADYLLGRVAGVPTDAPADSSDGRTETAKPSKGRSSSPAKTPTPSR